MKTIFYNVFEKKFVTVQQFTGENEVTKIIFDFKDTDVEDWNKWVYFGMADGSTSAYNLGSDVSVEYILTSRETKIGELKIQPVAKSGSQVRIYPLKKTPISETVDLLGEFTLTEDVLGYIDSQDAFLQSQIDDIIQRLQYLESLL